MVTLEQIFYGRGQYGYGILAKSQGATAYEKDVVSLCELIGTPDNLRQMDLFLVSKPIRDIVIMVAVQRGKTDSDGRSTVLFHALIGRKTELESANINAFVLQERGCFLDNVVMSPETLQIAPNKSSNIEMCKIRFPSVIMSPKPLPSLVRAMLAGEVNSRVWASFAFHEMAGFDFYVLDSHISSPKGVYCYDISGNLIPNMQKTEPLQQAVTHRKQERLPEVEVQNPPSQNNSLLIVSLIANVILLITAFMLYNPAQEKSSNQQQTTTSHIQSSELGSEQNKELIEIKRQCDDLKKEVNRLKQEQSSNESRDKIIADLREKFLQGFNDINNRRFYPDPSAISSIEDLNKNYSQYNANTRKPLHIFYRDCLDVYIKFVYTNIFNNDIK